MSSVPLSDSAARRCRDAVLLGRPIKVLSPEDLIVFKMVFFRAKDLADVERLVRFMGTELDHAYIRAWLLDMVGPDDHRVGAWEAIAAG